MSKVGKLKVADIRNDKSGLGIEDMQEIITMSETINLDMELKGAIQDKLNKRLEAIRSKEQEERDVENFIIKTRQKLIRRDALQAKQHKEAMRRKRQQQQMA